jgi:hypothetical protein
MFAPSKKTPSPSKPQNSWSSSSSGAPFDPLASR